jgi:hypothetical protein
MVDPSSGARAVIRDNRSEEGRFLWMLGAADRIVRNQDDTFDMALDDWKYELPNPARREGIRCNPGRFGIDRFTCFGSGSWVSSPKPPLHLRWRSMGRGGTPLPFVPDTPDPAFPGCGGDFARAVDD